MRRIAFKLFFAAVLAVCMTSCDSCSKGQDDLCFHVKASPAKFKTAMEGQDIPHIIDYRTAEEFAQGHIPGAVNIPVTVKDLDGTGGNCPYVRKVMEEFDLNSDLLVYGNDGGFGINGNAVPGQLACKYGSDKVTLLEGGYKAWVNAGYPTAQ